MDDFDDLMNNEPTEGSSGTLSKEDYAAKKKAERDEVFALADNTAMEVAGDGDRLQQYLDVQSTFTRYSAVNVLLILAQKPESTRLSDFDHWKAQGAYVKPGQAAISIVEPHEYRKNDGKPGTGYNIKKVFDISQVDARKVKATAPTPSFTQRQILAALVDKAPMKVSSVPELPDDQGAMTDPDTGEIKVCKGMSFSEIFKCTVQEMGNYEAKANPGKTSLDPSFVGYCAAYVLSKKYGVDTSDFSFLEAPVIFEDSNVQGIKNELSIIRDAVNNIGGRMDKHLDSVIKAAKHQESR
jgi:hypothetical protein